MKSGCAALTEGESLHPIRLKMLMVSSECTNNEKASKAFTVVGRPLNRDWLKTAVSISRLLRTRAYCRLLMMVVHI